MLILHIYKKKSNINFVETKLLSGSSIWALPKDFEFKCCLQKNLEPKPIIPPIAAAKWNLDQYAGSQVSILPLEQRGDLKKILFKHKYSYKTRKYHRL